MFREIISAFIHVAYKVKEKYFCNFLPYQLQLKCKTHQTFTQFKVHYILLRIPHVVTN